MRPTLVVLAAVGGVLLAGCGSGSKYRPECEREAARSGFGEDNQFRENAIKGCEEALENTHAPASGALEDWEREP